MTQNEKPARPAVGNGRIRSVIMLGIDCMRMPYLKVGGNAVNLCPTINDLARKGIICTNARSHGNPTQMAYPSIFSSTLPLDYGGYTRGVAHRPLTLAEALRASGLHTVALNTCTWLARFFCYDRGFDEFYEIFDVSKFWITYRDVYLKFFSNLYDKGVIDADEFCRIVGDRCELYIEELLRLCRQKQDELREGRFRYDKSLHRHDFSMIIEDLQRLHSQLGADKSAAVMQYLHKGNLPTLGRLVTGAAQGLPRGWFMRKARAMVKAGTRRLFQYAQVNHALSARYVRREVETVLSRAGGEPLFLWAHFLDIHDRRYAPGSFALPPDSPLFPIRFLLGGRNVIDMERAYCLRSIDKQIKRLMEFLDARGMLDSTLVVLFGDHGFSVNAPEKAVGNLFDESCHVPMIFYNPGLPPMTVRHSCGLIDLAPTVLDLM
ncbi:MAG: sulfatase-like hydrolase/transferase, partial [Phycisphaerae bacterium]|nr:sulfatase-like hydrolase/transferase [Phycisphaerae bacterium]